MTAAVAKCFSCSRVRYRQRFFPTITTHFINLNLVRCTSDIRHPEKLWWDNEGNSSSKQSLLRHYWQGPRPYLRWTKKFTRKGRLVTQSSDLNLSSPPSPGFRSPVASPVPLSTGPRHLFTRNPLTYQTLSLQSAEKLRQTTQKIRRTKEIMKEKMEEIIQRENVVTIPNVLCVTRIGLSPVIGYLVLHGSYDYALGIFVFAGVTDLLDGIIARQFPSQQSMLGSFLDPMADKFLVALLFLSLTAADMIPVPLTSLIIARDLCLMMAGFYVRYLSLPPPKTLSRYFDVTHATARLSPTLLSKINTSVQLSLVACTLAAPVFHMVDHPALHFLWYITAWTTISSGLSYVFSSDTFHLLRKSRHKLKENMLVRSNDEK